MSNGYMTRIAVCAFLTIVLYQPLGSSTQPDCQRQPTRAWTEINHAVVKTRVEPSWPDPFLNDTEGIIVLDVWIDEKGNVSCVKVTRGIPINDRAAVNAVRQWKFTPATLRGQPIAVVQEVRIVKQ